MMAILSKFSVLYLSSYFIVYLLKKLKLILFYNRVVYFFFLFLILLPHPLNNLVKQILCISKHIAMV